MHEMNDACLCSCKCNAIMELNTWGVTATMPPCCPRRPRHATRAALSSLCRGKHQMQVCLPRAHLSLPLSPSPDVATHGGCPWCGWAPAMARPTQGRSMAWRPLVLIFPFLPLSRCGHAWWLSPVRVDPAVPRSALRSLSNFSPHWLGFLF
jgi:hypothetical protein